MLADLDLLLIAVFCAADDLLPERAKNARRTLTDAEVVTLCVAQSLMGIPSDERFLEVARKQLRASVSAAAASGGLPQAARPARGHDRGADRRVRGREPRLPRRSGAGRLDPGRVRPQRRDDAAQPARRRGRLRLLRKPQPLLLGLPPARPVRARRNPTRPAADLPESLRTRRLPRHARPRPTQRTPDRVGDKGYAGRAFEHAAAELDATVCRPRRKDEPGKDHTSPRSDNGSSRSSRPAKTSSPSNATAPAPSTASEPASAHASSPSPPRSPSTTDSADPAAPSSTTSPEPVELLI